MSSSTMAKQGLEHNLAGELLAWYDVHGRDLPWRMKGGAHADPYRVWLSEIMLQQTTVATVRAYFEKFMLLWPTIGDLSSASLDDVLRAWAGLGYYARARNLHACAKHIAQQLNGQFPKTEKALRALPGIGPYTAAAIAAIAFGERHAAVDGNVERVISRLYAIEAPLPRAKLEIGEYARALMPGKRTGDFAQAMMDLGATICTPRSPNCLICPWAEHCEGRRLRLADTLPRRNPKAATPTRYGTAFWIERGDGAVLLRRRPEKGLLGGMMEVPSTEWTTSLLRKVETAAPLKTSWKKLKGKVEHTFTHFHLELSVLKAKPVIAIGELCPTYRWVPRQELYSEALPTVMRKVVALVLN